MDIKITISDEDYARLEEMRVTRKVPVTIAGATSMQPAFNSVEDMLSDTVAAKVEESRIIHPPASIQKLEADLEAAKAALKSARRPVVLAVRIGTGRQ